jgi:hypothetical protein
MRYNRANIKSTLTAAQHSATLAQKAKYVFATCYGFTINDSAIFGQDYYKVTMNEITHVEYKTH